MAKLYTLIVLMLIFGSAIVFADPTFTLTSNSNSANVGDDIQITLTFASGGAVGSFTNFDLTTSGLTLSFLPTDRGCSFDNNIGHCEYFGFPANPLTFSAHVDAFPATITLNHVQVPASDDLTDLNVNFVGSPLTIVAADTPGAPTVESCAALGQVLVGNVCAVCPDGQHVSSGVCVGNSPAVPPAQLSQEVLLTELETVLRNAPPGLNRLQQISHIARLFTRLEGGVQ